MFINKEDYLKQREALVNKAKDLHNEGKYEESIAVSNEINELQQEFENFAKSQANMKALEDNHKISNIAPLNKDNKIGFSFTEDMTDSVEYRKAFMNHVLKGDKIPNELRNEVGITKTTDVGTVIPKIIMQRIIDKIELEGMILSEVTRTSYKGGLAIPISAGVKPEAEWVAEGAGSEKHKTSTGEIVFAYHKLRVAINMTLEVTVTTLDIFETYFVSMVASAMIKALEKAIVSGDGAGKPKGILLAGNLDATNRDVAIAKGKTIGYDDLMKAEAALPVEYETNAKWFMSKKTFYEIASMVDSSGQPIGKVNMGGYNNRPEYTILNRPVIINNYMPTTNEATLGNRQIVAFLVNASDYILNTNYNMTTSRYTDNETEDEIIKSVMLVDGQLTSKESLITISKDMTV
ncbi:MAG: phage major capsid protein [Clostridium sp.]|nr:phage major capsid protein [Clostridium sp.]